MNITHSVFAFIPIKVIKSVYLAVVIILFCGIVAAQENESKSADGVISSDLLAFIGVIGAALIAGGFGLYELQKSISSQRALEEQKLILARRESELASEREIRSKFREDRILPFLEQLDKAVTSSYAVVQIPEYYADLIPYVPSLRRFADESLSKWIEALEKMSDCRVSMLLSIDPSHTNKIISLLEQVVDSVIKINEGRNLFLYKQMDLENLTNIHREYVSKSYQLMIEIKNAALHDRAEETYLSEEEIVTLAKGLSLPLEKGGLVAIPFGSHHDFSWISIWNIDASIEWQKYEESLTGTSLDQFDEALRGFADDVDEHKDKIDNHMVRIVFNQYYIYCFAAKFVGLEQRDHFISADLPNYRRKYPEIWSIFRSPREITVD